MIALSMVSMVVLLVSVTSTHCLDQSSNCNKIYVRLRVIQLDLATIFVHIELRCEI